MGGRGASSGVSGSSASVVTRSGTSLSNAPVAEFVGGKMKSRYNNTTPATDAQKYRLSKEIGRVKGSLRKDMADYRNAISSAKKDERATRRVEKKRYKGNFGRFAREALNTRFFGKERYEGMKKKVKALQKAKKTKLATEAIDALVQID